MLSAATQLKTVRSMSATDSVKKVRVSGDAPIERMKKMYTRRFTFTVARGDVIVLLSYLYVSCRLVL